MKKKKVVIALGGNALGNNLPEQMAAVKKTAKAIADLVEEGHQVVISHGNGPQVGMIHIAMAELNRLYPNFTPAPMSVCVGMSQGYIGYDLQNSIRTELLNRGISKPVSTIITQVCVDPYDEAFSNPTKPIGRFMSAEEAHIEEKRGNHCIEDAGRGFRRVVASPKPLDIVEIDAIRTLVNDGQIVIACGGGGIPVMRQDNGLRGASAVIDKDFASAKLAELLDADYLIILTAVEKVALNYGKPNQILLDEMTLEEAKKYCEEGHFASGSMLPKIQASMEFVSHRSGCRALITKLEKAKEGILGKTGTILHQ
ncbi:MAG: carbamate kinase [Lachnospiraceae bacterium]|nr:carbamate kinase [Lachnospiraceae bacterium]